MKVLVVEDGFEYSEAFQRFVREEFQWERAGDGHDALARLARPGIDVVFLDMRFDRVPDDRLLGDRVAALDRFNGDPRQAVSFLQDHQGTWILSAIRDAGHCTPVLMSYDFGAEPRRWAHLVGRHAPADWLPDDEGPAGVAARLRALVG